MDENGVDEDDDDKEEDIMQGPHIRLLFSVHNPRETHMISGLSEVSDSITRFSLSLWFSISY